MDTQKEMKVKKVDEDKDKIIVVTTGAKYIIEKSGKNGKISCYQLLNKERLIASINFDCSFSALSIERNDKTTCVLHQFKRDEGILRLQINSDSLLDICSNMKLSLAIHGNFLPEYSVEKDGNILLIDETGGIGIYPYQGLKNIELSNFTCKEWNAGYTLDESSQFLISIFPPRKFNDIQSFEERIAHHGSLGEWDPPPPPFPTNDEIEELAKYTNILVLHEMIWQGKLTREGLSVKTLADLYADVPFCCCEYVPVDEKELIRVVKKVHSLGMKVIPYMSPFYSTAKGKDFLDRVKNTLEKYGFDGVYFDGISMDILYSYQLIRGARELLKDKILYVHCSTDPLGRNIYCPFIDTYADYILRAESFKGFRTFPDKYLRYMISGYNISNSIGYICYYELPLDFIRKIINKTLAVKVRFYLGSPETEREKLLKKEYFPKLEDERNHIR